MMNVYNGNITTDKHGLATVALPDYFEALNLGPFPSLDSSSILSPRYQGLNKRSGSGSIRSAMIPVSQALLEWHPIAPCEPLCCGIWA